jgi:hypothetical protein
MTQTQSQCVEARTQDTKKQKKKQLGRPRKGHERQLTIEEQIKKLRKNPKMVDDMLEELRLLMLLSYHRLLASGEASGASTLDSIRKFLIDNNLTADDLLKKQETEKRTEEMEAWTAENITELPFNNDRKQQ